jgi:hypothetical protein
MAPHSAKPFWGEKRPQTHRKCKKFYSVAQHRTQGEPAPFRPRCRTKFAVDFSELLRNLLPDEP